MSIFSQILQLFPKNEFMQFVSETESQKRLKCFRVGINLYPCCFVNWVKPKVYVRSVMD